MHVDVVLLGVLLDLADVEALAGVGALGGDAGDEGAGEAAQGGAPLALADGVGEDDPAMR